MQKFLKLSAFIFITFFLFLIILGWTLEKQITELAIGQVSQTIEAPMGVEDIHFSLLRNFPLASIHFDHLWIAAPLVDSMANQPLDTLIKVAQLSASIDAIDAFKGFFTIRGISLSDGYINYTIDSIGMTRFDFLLSSNTTTQLQEQDTYQANTLDLAIEHIDLNNILCKYKDEQIKATATFIIEKISGELDIANTNITAGMKGSAELRDLDYDETNLQRMQPIDIDFDILYHNDTITTNSFSAKNKALTINANGDLILGEKICSEMELSLMSQNLATLINYAPDTLLPTYGISQITGVLAFNIKLEGAISENEQLGYKASLVISGASFKYHDYPLTHNLAIDLDASNGAKKSNKTTQININRLETDFDGGHIELQANMSNLDKIRYDLKSNLDLDLTKIRTLIPNSTINELNGNLKAFVATSGLLPDSIDHDFIRQSINATELDIILTNVGIKMDSVPEAKNISARAKFKQCQFDLINLEIYLPDYDLKLIDNSISACLTGDLLNLNTVNVDVSSFHFGMPESYIKGKISVNNMKKVSYDIQTDLNLDLAFWKQFAPDTLVLDINGRLLAKIKSYGELNLDSVETQFKDIIIDQTSADLTFEEVTLSMKDTLLNIENLNGAIIVKNHKINIDELKGQYAGVDFRIAKATVENPFNTTIRNQSGFIKVDGEYYFGDIDYTALGALMVGKNPDDSSSTEKSLDSIQWNLDVRGDVNIKSLSYDSATLLTGVKTNFQFTDTVFEAKGKLFIDKVNYGDAIASNVTGLYNVKKSEYIIDQLHFSAFDGDVIAATKIRLLPESQMLINLKAELDNLDMNLIVKQLPHIFDKHIKYEELTGVLTSDETYLQFLMKEKEIDISSLLMKSHVLFEDGGFYNYPPVTESLSLMPSTKDHPDTLLFNTVDSYIFIYQEALNIPETKIITNKLNAKMTGEQSFGKDYDYRVGINYKDVISKNKKVKSEKENLVNVDIDDVKLENLKWWKANGRKGKYKNIPITSDEFYKKQKIIRVRESWLDLKFHPERFNFDTQVD